LSTQPLRNAKAQAAKTNERDPGASNIPDYADSFDKKARVAA
jgi:hypothetical protein